MRDPHPARISGEKVHRVEHSVEWGYVIWGVLALLLVYLVFIRNTGSGEKDNPQGSAQGGI